MRVWGAPAAISDVTTAAGWTILGCDPTALKQDIRLVCTGDAANCDHLFQGAGAVNTLVRLPQNVSYILDYLAWELTLG
jgi:prolyl-tRNA editing enzyme YbaK/EbsC (Cys-tRNA(Pro) deacylase)